MDQNTKYTGSIAAAIAGICLIVVAVVAGNAYQSRNFQKVITVTGSTQQIINSDVVTWGGSFSRTVTPDALKQGNSQIKSDAGDVNKFLTSHGITSDEIDFQPVTVEPNYTNQEDSKGDSTQTFTGYTLTETFQVESKNLDKVQSAVSSSGDLLDQGIIFQSGSPQYFYSKLAELKIQMINDATKDATARAQAIAQNAGSKVGSLRSATVGIVQITPENSSDLSAEGEYDTTSIKKQVTVVVHANYSIQ